MNNKKLLIFDYDGVIVNSLSVVLIILKEIEQKYAPLKITSEDDIRELFRNNFFDSVQKLGLSKEKCQELLAEIKKYSLLYHDRFHPFPGIVSLLQSIKNMFNLTIISSNHSEAIKSELKQFGLEGIFHIIIGGEKITDKVEKIKLLLKSLSIRKENVYLISDTIGDIKEGKEAGIKTIAVSWGYHSKKLLETVKPDYLFEKVEDFGKFLTSNL